MARTPYKISQDHNSINNNQIQSKWGGIQKHIRYKSDWDDNCIVLDVSHHQAENAIEKKFNLNEVTLAVKGKNSIYGTNKAFIDFPNLCDITKLSLNACLFRYNNGKVVDAIGRQLGVIQKMFIWMTRNGIYQFSDLTINDFESLGLELAKSGWWGTLDYDLAFHELLQELQDNPEISKKLLGTGKATNSSIDYEYLKKKIGLPFPVIQIPISFREGLAAIWEDTRPIPVGSKLNVGNSPDSLIDTFGAINLLALFPEPFDCVSYLPFPDPSRVAKLLKPNFQSSRTNTISLNDAVSLFKEAVRWTYELAPAIIDLAQAVRDCIERISTSALLDKIDCQSADYQAANKKIKSVIDERYEKLKLEYKLPYPSIGVSTDSNSLKGLIYTLQTALFILIASNHGRRLNEIIGRAVPYGLYFGCMTETEGLEPDIIIDIYIEKTIQDYSKFSCNRIVADCIQVLEKLYQIFRPINSKIKVIDYGNVTKNRKEKLFQIRNFSILGFLGESHSYDFSSNSSEFFRLAGVEKSILNNRAHPYRRLFSLLYMNRFDHPELLALQQHLRHKNPESTRIYVSSENGALAYKDKKRLNDLAKSENDDFDAELRNASIDYLKNKIMDLLDGERVGGYFPKLVGKLVQRLNQHAEFINVDKTTKVDSISETLIQRGFIPLTMDTGVCMVGHSKHTQKLSACYSHGKINPDKATPQTCGKCINHLYPTSSIVILDKEIHELLTNSENEKFPKNMREAAKKEAQSLLKIREFELSLAEENKRLFDSLTLTWLRHTS